MSSHHTAKTFRRVYRGKDKADRIADRAKGESQDDFKKAFSKWEDDNGMKSRKWGALKFGKKAKD